MSESKFVGVDGCRYGWFSVGFSQNGHWEPNAFPTFQELLTHYAGAELILVDIPIGLPDSEAERPCDKEARKQLGRPRGSSVFRAPTRQTAYQVAQCPGDYGAAKKIERQFTNGKGLSKQTFAIAAKIAEVDKVMSPRESRYRGKVREIHPEICFWALNDEKPMKHRKGLSGGVGIEERLCVLENERVEPRAQEIFDAAWARFKEMGVAKDDIVDALAAAVTAYRGWPNNLQTLPANPPMDATRLPMEMVFWEP